MTGDDLPGWARKAATAGTLPRPDRPAKADRPPRPEPPLPSKARMAGELVRTIGRVAVHAAKTGRVKASEEEKARRWEICRACVDHFRPSDKRCGAVPDGQRGCGCWLEKAIPYEAKHCPVGKW